MGGSSGRTFEEHQVRLKDTHHEKNMVVWIVGGLEESLVKRFAEEQVNILASERWQRFQKKTLSQSNEKKKSENSEKKNSKKTPNHGKNIIKPFSWFCNNQFLAQFHSLLCTRSSQ